MAMDLPPSIGLPNGPRVDPPRGRLVNIAILGGTGKEGAGLAIRWALAGHSIIIGSRDAERARGKAAELREITKKLPIVGHTNAEAAELGDVVVIATPARCPTPGRSRASPRCWPPSIAATRSRTAASRSPGSSRPTTGERSMAESAILVSYTRLHEFIVTALVAMKMSRPIAEVTAGLMVRTDLRGVDSHGIGMLPRYHELWQAGYIRMDAEPSVVRDEVATGLFDGQKGLGHYVSTRAMQA